MGNAPARPRSSHGLRPAGALPTLSDLSADRVGKIAPRSVIKPFRCGRRSCPPYAVPYWARASVPGGTSLRITTPPFMTNFTRSISLTSASGFPATAMMSANLPRSMLPIWLAQS